MSVDKRDFLAGDFEGLDRHEADRLERMINEHFDELYAQHCFLLEVECCVGDEVAALESAITPGLFL